MFTPHKTDKNFERNLFSFTPKNNKTQKKTRRTIDSHKEINFFRVLNFEFLKIST